jgi:hypothetical protein
MAIGPALAQASAPAGGKPASAAGGPPAASLPHDLRTQHLRLRAVCNQQIEQQGLKGEDAKVYLHKCLLGG